MPQTGSPAPDFTLPSTQGPLTLSHLWREGPVVLAFYSEDATPACSQMLASFIGEQEALRGAGARVVAVSADPLEAHHRFCQALGGCPFPLASDPDLSVGRLYGVVEEGAKRHRRAVFVIERGGRLLHQIPHYQPGNVAHFLEVFQALGAVG